MREAPGSRTTKPIVLLIPVFGRQEKLNRALASVEPEADILDVIVIDDGSVPAIEIAPDSPLEIHLIRLATNQGLANALNAGMQQAFESGYPYIARLDSDDIAVACRFNKQLEFMRTHADIGICGTAYHEYDPRGNRLATIIPPQDDTGIRKGMHLRTTICHPTVMIRTAVARRIGYFDQGCKSEDLDYFVRALTITKAANLQEALVHYEVGSSDALTGTAARRRAIAIEILQRKWQTRDPSKLLWWLGLLAAMSYLLGVNQWLAPFRNFMMRSLDRRGQ